MADLMKPPTAGYNFNQFQEIKSHSSILFNERMAIMFYLLDMKSIKMNKNYSIDDIHEVRATLFQLYKNIRMLIRFNPMMRNTMNLETKDPGIYITDLIFSTIDKMIEYCELNGYTIKRLYIVVQEINKAEMIVKDILQYYHYFIRPDFRQKPDIEMATEKYKEMADKKTVQELQDIVGNKHKVKFDNLGSQRIELINNTIEDELSIEEDEEDILEEDKLGTFDEVKEDEI